MTTQDLDRIRFVTRHFNELRGLRYGVPLGLMTLSVGGTTYFENRPLLLLRAALLLGGLLLLFRSGAYYRRTFGEVERQSVLPVPVLESLSIYCPAGPPPRLAVDPLVNPAARRLLLTTGLAFALLFTLRSISPAVTITTDESLVQAPWLTLNDSLMFVGGEPMAQEAWATLKVQMTYGLYGSLFLGVWLWRGHRLSQSHYLITGLLLLGLSALAACLGFGLRDPRSLRLASTLLAPVAAHFWLALLLCGASAILVGLLDHRQLVRAAGRTL